MKYFILSLITLAGIYFSSFRISTIEENLQSLSLNDKVRFKVGSFNELSDFRRLTQSDEGKVDSDLAKYKMQRVSAVFISNDGKYVITFAKESNDQIKRVIFTERNHQLHAYGDDVTAVGEQEIKTTTGSVEFQPDHSIE